MNFKANIQIMPLAELLDPQGKAVTDNLSKLGLEKINNVRIGKHITLEIEANDKEDANKIAEDACKKLLVNQVMESFVITID